MVITKKELAKMCYGRDWKLTPELETLILEIYGENPENEYNKWSEQDIYENVRKTFRNSRFHADSKKILKNRIWIYHFDNTL